MRNDIATRSRDEAEQVLPHEGDNLSVVSIGSPGEPKPKGFRDHDPEHKRFEFDDIRNEPTPAQKKFYKAPSRKDVAQIIEHGRKAERPLLSHCKAGVSRGPAASWAIRCARGANPEQALHEVVKDRPEASPNPRMVRMADDILDLDGKMVEALKNLPPPRKREAMKRQTPSKEASGDPPLNLFPHVYSPSYSGGDPRSYNRGKVAKGRDVWKKRHEHDEVFSLYDVPELEGALRLKKGQLDELRDRGFTPQMNWIAADIDTPGKESAGKRDIDAYRRRSKPLQKAGVYSTPHGARAVWPLASSVAPEEGEDVIEKVHDHLQEKNIPVDRSTSDWTRLYRMPSTNRDFPEQGRSGRYDPDVLEVDSMKPLEIEELS